jgi:hypothetical protein
MTLPEKLGRARKAVASIADDPSIETEYERLYLLKAMRDDIEDRIWDLKLATGIGLWREKNET